MNDRTPELEKTKIYQELKAEMLKAAKSASKEVLGYDVHGLRLVANNGKTNYSKWED